MKYIVQCVTTDRLWDVEHKGIIASGHILMLNNVSYLVTHYIDGDVPTLLVTKKPMFEVVYPDKVSMREVE